MKVFRVLLNTGCSPALPEAGPLSGGLLAAASPPPSSLSSSAHSASAFSRSSLVHGGHLRRNSRTDSSNRARNSSSGSNESSGPNVTEPLSGGSSPSIPLRSTEHSSPTASNIIRLVERDPVSAVSCSGSVFHSSSKERTPFPPALPFLPFLPLPLDFALSGSAL